jgi:hypothetical protein
MSLCIADGCQFAFAFGLFVVFWVVGATVFSQTEVSSVFRNLTG